MQIPPFVFDTPHGDCCVVNPDKVIQASVTKDSRSPGWVLKFYLVEQVDVVVKLEHHEKEKGIKILHDYQHHCRKQERA